MNGFRGGGGTKCHLEISKVPPLPEQSILDSSHTMISRLTAIKTKDGAQQCRTNYHDFYVFSCSLSIGTLPKITIVSISAPGKLLILNHLLSDKNDNVSAI